jgi:hypothetical protein
VKSAINPLGCMWNQEHREGSTPFVIETVTGSPGAGSVLDFERRLAATGFSFRTAAKKKAR